MNDPMHPPSAIFAAIESNDAAKLRALLAADSSLASARDASGVSAIMQVLYRRQQETLDLLLAASPELDIFEAAAAGRKERVAELLQRNPALAKSWSADGFTPLHFACFFGRDEIVSLLLQHGAEVAAVSRNPMQVMPLHSAAAAHSLAIVHLLLKHGAPLNSRQQQGWTALHSAAQNGDEAMVKLLLHHGADRTAANDDGTTPAALAAKSGHPHIAHLLA
jgi:uncharacterized protein